MTQACDWAPGTRQSCTGTEAAREQGVLAWKPANLILGAISQTTARSKLSVLVTQETPHRTPGSLHRESPSGKNRTKNIDAFKGKPPITSKVHLGGGLMPGLI